jgi:hypothetical protein
MKKIKLYILVTFICLLITNSLYAQENPHDRMVKRMKESGLTDKEIEKEIKEMDVLYQKHIDEEFQKIQDEITKNQKANQAQRTTNCTDIPASEKAVLQAIYNNLNGAAWATGWDFTQPVTSWNGTTGWKGIVVNNCHVEQFTVNNINVQGVFPDVTNLSHLKNLFIGHGMFGHSLPYYITGDFSSIGNLPLLNSLTLHNSDFQGEIPSTFNNLDLNFWGLSLAHCNLSNNNQLCSIISNFSNLDHLNLSSNYYSGILPNCFSGSNFIKLSQILISDNNFSDISILSTHNKLVTLWAGWNDIQGVFPDLSNNLNLANTRLDGNYIEGQIPNNFPSNVYVLMLDNNKLKGNIPQFNPFYSFYSQISIKKNKFKFKDFENNYNHYQNNFTDFFYSNQAKTDAIINQTINTGASYTMTMHTDGNFSTVEEYQWYKGTYPSGTLIADATQRQYTINDITTAHVGSYYCVSKHPTITVPSNSNKNLVLVREPINLTVSNTCPPLGFDIETWDYPCINQPLSFSLGIGAIPSGTSLSWKIIDSNDTIIHTSNGSYLSYTFDEIGTYTIKLGVTIPNGCSYTLLKTVEVFPTCTSCTATNPNTSTVKQLFINLINHLRTLTSTTVFDGYTCSQLDALAPYVQEDGPIAIYNFETDGHQIGFSFANHGGQYYGNQDVWIVLSDYNNPVQDIDLTEYVSYNQRTLLLGKIFFANGVSKGYVKHINFCPTNQLPCTATNPNTPIVKQHFINLINHLKTLPTSSVPNGYTCPQLTLLAPYVQPYSPVAIYNFINANVYVGFSFVDNGTGASADIQIPYHVTGNTVTDINLANYTDYSTSFTVNTHLSDGNIDIHKGYIKNIEFCPDELFCTKHIAIVVDESGSIDEAEARKIRFQLKSFIEQQTEENETLGSNVRVSLIGLSDSDNNSRTDHVTPSGRLTSTNKSDYLTWINKYRLGRVSPNSDFWNSGLKQAYGLGAELVILITDGCQTANAGNLKETVRKFNNNNGGNSNPNAPHLFVIGLDNGFYVANDSPLNGRQSYTPEEDPNLNPSVQRSAGGNSRVASFLRTSLKFLMGYDGSEFPVNNKYNFVLNPFDGSMVDYYGANDFLFFYDEPNYLYNGSVRTGTSCGEEIPLEKCDNCLNFKPTPGKEYIVSAWAMEELKVQVKDFTNPEIHIRFTNNTNDFTGIDEICVPTGDIIDGWQRIFKKFTVPENTVYIEIALVNKSGSVPVYFDDIRIHPLDGSMKSFVYDPETFRLMSELDENNYSTFYEYDNEGGLVRVKKETSRGVKTIQETRSGNVIKVD